MIMLMIQQLHESAFYNVELAELVNESSNDGWVC